MRLSREMEMGNPNVILSEKRKGETMGQLTKRVRRALTLSPDTKIAFAGRLDPLATGLVVFTINNHDQRDEIISLHKTYSFDVVYGVHTDSGDVLGHVTNTNDYKPTISEIKQSAQKVAGSHEQTYPIFSSKTVEGKPLYKHARDDSLSHIELPSKEIEVFSLSLERCLTQNIDSFKREVEVCIASVHGDFRQKNIQHSWNSYFNDEQNGSNIQICSFLTRASSGTYIRALARHLAEASGSVGLAHNIRRIQIGNYHVSNACV